MDELYINEEYILELITSPDLSNYFSDLLLTTIGDLLAIDEYLRPTPSILMKFYSKYEHSLRNEKFTPQMVRDRILDYLSLKIYRLQNMSSLVKKWSS